MLPVIASIGPITLYTFGLVLFTGFFLTVFLIWKKGREEHYDEEHILDVILIASFWSLVAARLGYILSNLSNIGIDLAHWINIIGNPGYNVYVALVVGFVVIWRQAKQRRWDFFEFADITAIGVAFFSAFIWLGAFLNGSAIGIETNLFLSIQLQGESVRRLPIQLLGLGMTVILFGLLWWAEERYRTFAWYRANKNSARSGFVFFCFLIGLGIVGLLTHPFFADGWNLYGIRLDMVFWLVLFVIGVIGVYIRSSRDWKSDFPWMSRDKTGIPVRHRRSRRRYPQAPRIGDDIL